MMEIQDRPPLYKYRDLGGEFGRTNIEHIIRHNELYWQSPRSFNDPFDCLPFFRLGRGSLDKSRYVSKLVGHRAGTSERLFRRQERRKILNIGPARMRELAELALAGKAIQSFTLKPDCMLMWAHYGRDHTGVCVRFQQLGRPSPFLGLDVEYSQERPEADLTRMIDETNKFLRSAILTKAQCWEYEAEKRMISDTNGDGYRKFPLAALTGVILGAKISSDDEDFVRTLLVEHRPDIEVLRSKMHMRHYHLSIEAA